MIAPKTHGKETACEWHDGRPLKLDITMLNDTLSFLVLGSLMSVHALSTTKFDIHPRVSSPETECDSPRSAHLPLLYMANAAQSLETSRAQCSCMSKASHNTSADTVYVLAWVAGWLGRTDVRFCAQKSPKRLELWGRTTVQRPGQHFPYDSV